MALTGEIEVDSQSIGENELLYLPQGETGIDVKTDIESRVVLIGGAPFETPVTIWWNFVGHSK